jgi:hypothetical protein
MKTLVSTEMTPAFLPEYHQGDATVENEWHRRHNKERGDNCFAFFSMSLTTLYASVTGSIVLKFQAPLHAMADIRKITDAVIPSVGLS